MDSLRECSWPLERLGDAIEAIGRRGRLLSRSPEATSIAGDPPAEGEADLRLERWVETAARRIGLEAEPVEVPYPEVDRLLRGSPPAILWLRGSPEAPGARFLALLPGKRRRLMALGPDHALHAVEPEAVRALLCRDVESSAENRVDVDAILHGARIQGRRQARARAALLDELLSTRRIGGCWLIRPAGTASVREQARETRLGRLFATLLAAHAIYFVLWILSWWLLGRAALTGRLDLGWLLAWGLILLTLIPFRLLANYSGGVMAVRAGTLLKRRLLFGALRLDADEVRHLGTGQLLGRVMESDVLEQVAITGGFLVTALVELILAGAVLVIGAGGWLHLLLLAAWLAATLWISLRYLRRRREWTDSRLSLTNDLVERMVGHRTRLAQEARERWNDGEDRGLAAYHGLSRSLDRAGVILHALVPRGWFIAGVLGLVPAFVAGGPSIAHVAIGVGGVILAFQAFRDLVEGIERILAVAVAWEKVRDFWTAASRPEQLGQPGFDLAAFTGESTAGEMESSGSGAPLLDAHEVYFRYRDRAEPVLRGLDLRLHRGDRLLLEGPSGGGKSTLGMVLAACRVPDSGLLLLEGLDLETVGRAGWGRRVIIVPQFHDNHVLLGSFSFNLLMGRGWPPSESDLKEAEEICRALGLGPLLDSMPGGLAQPVGETGWQLSHGERGRLFIARALLQGAEVIILDESFAALDPETLHRALGHVLEKAPTLMVIAHP